MNSVDTFWTAFGAVAQLLGAIATFAAVLVSLKLARAVGHPNLKFWIDYEQDLMDESQENIVFNVANIGKVSAEITGIGWEISHFNKHLRFAEFDLSHGRPIFPIVVEAGQAVNLYLDVKRSMDEIKNHPEIYRLRLLPRVSIARRLRGIVHLWSGSNPKVKPSRAVFDLILGKPRDELSPVTLRPTDEIHIYGNID